MNGEPKTRSTKEDLLTFLKKSPMDRLIAHAKVSNFSRDALVCLGDQLADFAYLVLKGACEHRRSIPNDGSELIQQFPRGSTFGGLPDLSPDNRTSAVVATEDSIVLGIRMEDLARLASDETDAHDTKPTPNSATHHHTTYFFRALKGRLATLLFLSDALPSQLLSESIAHRLHTETGGSVVLVKFVSSENKRSSNDEPVDCTLDSEGLSAGHVRQVDSGLHILRVGLSNEPPCTGALGELFRRLRHRFQYVLINITAEQLPAEQLFETISHSSSAYLFLRRTAEDLYRFDLLLHELRPRLNSHLPVELKPVLCLADKENVEGYDARIENTGVPLQLVVRGCPLASRADQLHFDTPSGSFQADVRRIARTIGDCLVGLALSSGGAKGFAHIGVIQVLEENGIEVDAVAGASMGAYVGSIWAYGRDGSQLESIAREMEARWAIWGLIDPVFPPRQGFLRGNAVKHRLKRTLGEVLFADLVRPLRVIATDLDTLARVVFAKGSVADAVHASIAVPGICVPVRLGDSAYVDGGIVDPLPTDVLREMGVRRVIAVNTIPTPERIQYCLQAQRELSANTEKRARKLARKIVPLDQHLNYFARGNILEILMHSIHGAQTRMAEASCTRAAIVLRPEVWSDRWLDFRHPVPYIRAGRDVARQHLDEIKDMVLKKEVFHEIQPSPKTAVTAR